MSTGARVANGAPLLSLRGVCKNFPGVKALANVDLTARRGEIHALMGENGAGKSTLIKVLTGVYRRDNGEMLLNGDLPPGSPISQVKLARELGVSATPLREAMRLLQAEGLLVAEHNRRARVASIDPADIDALSEAEQRVATLAADGLTNREIAGKLYITVSTVEQHLTRVYRKLHVNRRSELRYRLRLDVSTGRARTHNHVADPGAHPRLGAGCPAPRSARTH